MRKALPLLFLSFLVSIQAWSQVGQGTLKGTVVEAGNNMPIPFANIALKQNGSLVTGGSTDFDGNFQIKPITPGSYNVEISSLGFGTKVVSNVKVTADKITVLDKNDTKLKSAAQELGVVDIVEYKVPLIEKDGGATSTTVTSEDIEKMAARSPADIAATAGGTYAKDDGSNSLNVRGSRSDANYYFIDGIKVRGSSSIPQGSIEQVTVLTGGLPAQYGDVTGGVINITTKGVSSEYHGGVEILTSGAKLSDDAYVGFDPYGYNLIEFSLSGPLYSRKDTAGNKKPLLGFRLSGNVVSQLDPRPSAVGAWKVKDEVLEGLKTDPLRAGFGGGGSVIANTDYLRINDFERVKVRPNVANRGANVAGKIDVTTTETTNLTFGGSLNFSTSKTYDFDHSLLDYENYADRISNDWRVYARFTQRFNNDTEADESKSASTIKNAYYSIQADYSQTYDRRWSADHQDNFFNYGYIGKFETYQTENLQPGVDSLTGITGRIQQTFEDTLISFVPGDVNPELTAYTQRYYELYGWEGFDDEGNPVFNSNLAGDALVNYNNIQSGGGLVNGDNFQGRGRNVYNLWIYNSDPTNARGAASDSYLEQITNQFRITATGSADIGNHAILLGFEYEQRVDRAYSLSPRFLWTLARLRANTHVDNLDFSRPTVSYPGPDITYPRLNSSPGAYAGDNRNDNIQENQSFIDYNLRNAIGLDPDGTDFLDVNSIDPSTYQLEFFSTDELLNNGQSLVSYYGYDAYGNRLSANPSFNDFFNEVDEFNNHTRPIGAFQPIYVAGYIQDKFAFDDLIFNVGLRVDRFDANQQVLKDKYVLFPTVKAGEEEAFALLAEDQTSHPSNIGEDFVVYVDNVENPTSILGYRDGDIWYNAQGAELQDASALRISNGLPAPLLVDKENTNSVDINEESFEDYTPQTNIMPRVAFSFPISDEANFFAHYDVLTKRPTTGNRLDPSDFYFLESRASSAEIDNPALRPEKTIDYEVGFNQALNTSSALKISAFYREFRDQVQVLRVFDAYPIEYRSFENLDFGTVKGTTITYDLRQTKNMSIRLAYTLQFAEGTGSSATSSLNLARTGEPNLRAPIPLSYDQRHQFVGTIDYRYGEGGEYNGPIVMDKRILENFGANITLRGGSGEPYSPQANYSSSAAFANNPSPTLDGGINSSRLPWKFRFDLRVDKDIKFKQNENAKRQIGMNVYFQILNVLNARNINNVFRATGNPDDDGYINSPLGLEFTAEQNSPLAYREYYTMKLWNPNNWELPRRIRLGVAMNF